MDDIERSYGGGPLRGYYSGQYTSSTNAYMLMYRQIDHRRNKNAMNHEEFPPHLKELHNLLERKAEEDRQMRERERDMYKVSVHFANYLESGILSSQFDCSGTTTIDQLKEMAIEVICLYLCVNDVHFLYIPSLILAFQSYQAMSVSHF